ncbi:TPA: hypothetical protein LEM85_001091 [Listeria monocytogenes]|nr:hypothetical protein [Listeria monocytogenes]
MAYEKTKIVVASGDGKIYLCTLDRDGHMTDSRKDVTKDVLRATAEYFMKNKYKRAQFPEIETEQRPTLFFTNNPEIAEDILLLLQSDNV